MYTQLDSKSKTYEISKRNFLNDYANYESLETDMTMSGKYLYKYPKLKVNYKQLCEYPTHKSIKELTEKIKENQKIMKKEIIIGAGANGIIQNIVKILFDKGGNLITPFLTFNQAEYAVTAIGGYTKRAYMNNNVNISTSNIIKSIDSETKMIYICNPNNPTGLLMSYDEILEIAKSTTGYLVIDESAIEFSKNKENYYEDLPDNVVIVKSFSKAYGIANLRIGYMICSKKFKELYDKNITINEVSGISCEYTKKLISNYNYKRNVKITINERKKLEKELNKLGLEFFESESNILFTKTKLTNKILEKFKNNGISVVSTYDENKNLHIRIAVQDKKTNDIFIKKCKKIFGENLEV